MLEISEDQLRDLTEDSLVDTEYKGFVDRHIEETRSNLIQMLLQQTRTFSRLFVLNCCKKSRFGLC